MVVEDTKIYHNMKNKRCLSVENNIKGEKKSYDDFKEIFSIRKLLFFLRSGLL